MGGYPGGGTWFGVCRRSLMAFCTAFFPIHGCPRCSRARFSTNQVDETPDQCGFSVAALNLTELENMLVNLVIRQIEWYSFFQNSGSLPENVPEALEAIRRNLSSVLTTIAARRPAGVATCTRATCSEPWNSCRRKHQHSGSHTNVKYTRREPRDVYFSAF